MWEWSNPASYHGAVRVECIIQIDAFYLTVKAGSLAIAERTLRIRKSERGTCFSYSSTIFLRSASCGITHQLTGGFHESQALRPYGRVIEWDVCFFWHPGSLELNMPNCFA